MMVGSISKDSGLRLRFIECFWMELNFLGVKVILPVPPGGGVSYLVPSSP